MLGFRVTIFVLLISALFAATASAEGNNKNPLGPQGAEGARLREQLWRIPSRTSANPIVATVFQPTSQAADAVQALVIINHGSPTSAQAREAFPQPPSYSFYVAKWFVDRGHVAVLPTRRGHGATGGPHAETMGACEHPSYVKAGNAGADDIEDVVQFMREQSQIPVRSITVVGLSTGGWATLALAARNLPGVVKILNFAGGRGAYAYGRPKSNCAPDRLVEAARSFGAKAKVPTLWLYSENDSFFTPELATAMSTAWKEAGGQAEFHLLPASGNDGHLLFDRPDAISVWGPIVEMFLAKNN